VEVWRLSGSLSRRELCIQAAVRESEWRMISVVKRIAIASLLIVPGIMLFEARDLVANYQGVQKFRLLPNSQVLKDSRVAQNPPNTAPSTPSEQQTPAPKIPIRTEISRFDNWIVTCNEFQDGSTTRKCSALLEVIQDKTQRPVFSWTIEVNEKKQLISVFQTPTGVAIAPGVQLRIGKSPARTIPFASCETGHCVATTLVDANLLREMTTSPTAQAVIQGLQGNIVEFAIQLKGFDKAYATLTRP
jgi:invasion protein IalB